MRLREYPSLPRLEKLTRFGAALGGGFPVLEDCLGYLQRNSTGKEDIV